MALKMTLGRIVALSVFFQNTIQLVIPLLAQQVISCGELEFLLTAG
jgi:hypothetical protein